MWDCFYNIEMFSYPYATVSQIQVPNAVWWELERRLVLIFLGKTHSSSAVHEQVIAGLEREGEASPRLEALRHTAGRSRDAICAGDFVAFGRAMITPIIPKSLRWGSRPKTRGGSASASAPKKAQS